ncbi:family 43 glycosylhydrolase [Sinomicrobium kalidii]|uniref:family 43 glycosylhydrolase n=1 Tax=Sinomicrobium kalidii TaxID=2900738 RepID=UPI001E53ADED|nr:family 43 glycosylhydrolase [Sinomicrobium kalidii]UGU15677.1 family 43 glycosylhydrolase [Sinomicrobium kalidii]
MKIRFLMVLQIGLVIQNISGQERYEAIHSGIPWFDQFNNEVNAHGACIVEENGRYYLFGEYKSDTNVFMGFSCYSSTDLKNWEFEKIVLPRQPDGLLGPGRIGERVKVMKCPETGEFIMYMHTDDRKYNDPHIGYATSKTVNGDYQFQGAILHEGKPIRKWDMGTFRDTDGKGYLLIHHGLIYELSSDYKSVKRLVTSQKGGGESPAMFKKDGVYYWLSSNLTSWERNDNTYMTATSPEGPWTMKGLFAPKGTLTWNSQCSFVFPVTNTKDTLFMYMGDRWSFPRQGSSATQVWQPITVRGDTMSIPEFQENWQVDMANVRWSPVDWKKEPVKDKSRIVRGHWETNKGIQGSNEKGAAISYTFTGQGVGIKAVSNNTSGYGRVIIKNSKGEEVVNSIMDFYSKYEYSSQKFLSPFLEKDTYTLSIEVLGEHPKWSDKSLNTYGSTDDYVRIEDVFVVKK